MTTKVVINLITREDQFRHPIHYHLESYLESSLSIHGNITIARFLIHPFADTSINASPCSPSQGGLLRTQEQWQWVFDPTTRIGFVGA